MGGTAVNLRQEEFRIGPLPGDHVQLGPQVAVKPISARELIRRAELAC